VPAALPQPPAAGPLQQGTQLLLLACIAATCRCGACAVAIFAAVLL
jgi:hypothetical protein